MSVGTQREVVPLRGGASAPSVVVVRLARSLTGSTFRSGRSDAGPEPSSEEPTDSDLPAGWIRFSSGTSSVEAPAGWKVSSAPLVGG